MVFAKKKNNKQLSLLESIAGTITIRLFPKNLVLACGITGLKKEPGPTRFFWDFGRLVYITVQHRHNLSFSMNFLNYTVVHSKIWASWSTVKMLYSFFFSPIFITSATAKRNLLMDLHYKINLYTPTRSTYVNISLNIRALTYIIIWNSCSSVLIVGWLKTPVGKLFSA